MSFLYLCREALRFEHGIKVSCSDPSRLRQVLYAERREGGEPELETLELRISPINPETELWIVPKRSSEE